MTAKLESCPFNPEKKCPQEYVEECRKAKKAMPKPIYAIVPEPISAQ